MSKKVSMKRIASELGVSVALVSYVLNGKMTERINPQTAAKIKALAKELNYQPNQIAKSLKNKKTHTLGLIIADISNFFYSYLARYVEEEANENGYNVLFGSAYENPERFEQLLNVLIGRQVDGLILAIPEGAEDQVAKLNERGIPYVIIDREFPQFEKINTINLDNYESSKSVVQHLVNQGFKRLGAIGLETKLHHLKERKRGYIEEATHILGCDNIIAYDVAENKLSEKMEDILQDAIYCQKVDAICFFTNKISMAALPVILKLRLKVPKDIAIICYDETEAYALFPYSLSYVKQPLQAMGQLAVKHLIDPKQDLQGRHVKFQAELIIQNSSQYQIKT